MTNNKKNTKVVSDESGLKVELSKTGEKQSKDLSNAMGARKTAKQSGASKVPSKYLDKTQVDSAVETIKSRLADLNKAESAVVVCAIELGKELVALQNGLPKGEFYPLAEKQFKLKRASLKLYISVYKNASLVKNAQSLNEARNMITKKNTGSASAQEKQRNGESQQEPTIRAPKEKRVKDLSPEDAADVIIEAIQNTIAKMPEKLQKSTIAKVKELMADLAI